jgi:hypothetical protein
MIQKIKIFYYKLRTIFNSLFQFDHKLIAQNLN